MKVYSFIIGGKERTSSKTAQVFSPSTGELIGEVYQSTEADVDEAVNNAETAQKKWAALGDEERKDYLMKAAEVLNENKQYLAEWITKEQGKPLAGPGSLFEMEACIGWTQVPASLDLPVETLFEDDTRKDEMHRKPIGVVAAIAPWNWPLMIAIWQIMPSLRAGNTVVLKPSEYTPIGTLEMIRLLNGVFPPGVLNVVTGTGAIGAKLIEHPKVGKIMFTGSISTGKKVIESSAKNMARLTLECGGNDAAIVLPGTKGADIAEGLFWGTFLNMGQTCACIKRLYIHQDDHDEIVTALSSIADQIRMGNGLEEGIVLGPIQNKMQFDKVSNLVEDAKQNGAKVVRGGSPLGGAGYFYPVTLVTNIDNGARLVDEEQFGPVLPIITYSTIDEAIEKANALETGLGASVWGDKDAAVTIAGKLEAGTVWINQHGAIHPFVPFGGIKKSGYGVEFGIEGLKAVTIPKVISIKK